MFGKMRTPRTSLRKTLSHAPSRQSVRPRMEQLEDRTVPSTFNSLLGVGPHAADLRAALTDVKSDVAALTRALGTPTGAVSTDLGNVTTALNTVAADLTTAGTPATTTASDLQKLAAAETTLAADLGTSVSRNVRRDLRDLSSDVTHVQHLLDPDNNVRNGDHNRDRDDRGPSVGRPASLLGQAVDVQSDLAALQSDVTALTAALGTNPTPAVTNALNNVSADLTTVSNDLTSGLPTTADLQTLAADQAALVNAVGSGATAAVRQDLSLLRSDVTDLSTDVGQLTNGVNRAAADIQADASQLTQQLGSSLGQTASGALNTLNGAVTTLASDLAAGKLVGSDLTTALNDEFSLVQALNGQISGAAAHTFYDLATDLTSVALAASVSANG